MAGRVRPGHARGRHVDALPVPPPDLGPEVDGVVIIHRETRILALRDLQPQIELDENVRLAAKKSLDRMLEMAGGTLGKGDLGRA